MGGGGGSSRPDMSNAERKKTHECYIQIGSDNVLVVHVRPDFRNIMFLPYLVLEVTY